MGWVDFFGLSAYGIHSISTWQSPDQHVTSDYTPLAFVFLHLFLYTVTGNPHFLTQHPNLLANNIGKLKVGTIDMGSNYSANNNNGCVVRHGSVVARNGSIAVGGCVFGSVMQIGNCSSIILDGKPVNLNNKKPSKVKLMVDDEEYAVIEGHIDLRITANTVEKVDIASGSVYVEGPVGMVKTMSGSVTCEANIQGSVSTMSGNVTCSGEIGGRTSTMSGDIRAGSKRKRY